MNILTEIAEKTRERVASRKRLTPLAELRRAAETKRWLPPFAFRDALSGDGLSFICEIKKASPSQGIIAEDFPYLKIAAEYEEAGAAAVSVLTEPYYFLGDDRYLLEIAEIVNIPILRKDFTIDEYMLYEAKALGAGAALLIAALLERAELEEYLEIARGLGISAIVEVHDEREAEAAINAGAEIIGVNNRDLRTFEVSLATSERLRRLVPPGVIFVAESGIKTPQDVARMRKIGADAVLIGETIMRSADKSGVIAALRAFDRSPEA